MMRNFTWRIEHLFLRAFSILGVIILLQVLIAAKPALNSFHEQFNVTYEIKNLETVQNADDYIASMNTANFNHYRLKNSRQVIQFEGGVQIELYSAEEVRSKGIVSINPSDFPEKWGPDKNFGTFRLAPGNFIIELKDPIRTK